MTDRVRIGIAGCGAITQSVHVPLLARRADVVVHALVDADPDALAAANVRCAGARPYATLDDMLAESPPDAVIVALPTAAHAAAATAVLEAGCDLYLEKPLAACLAEGETVVDSWRASGRIAMVGFNARFNPLILQLRELIHSGRAGDPVYVRSVFATAPRAMPEWKRHRATGGGALLDLGVHHIDLIRSLFGREFVSVRATLEPRASDEDTVLLELELDGGPRVHGFFSLAAAEHDGIDVYGDRARLSVSRFTSLAVTVTDNPGLGGGSIRRLARRAGALRNLSTAARVRRAPLREPGYAVALDRFVAAVRTRRLAAEAADPADGLACLAVVDAAERSAASGRVESIAGRRTPARAAGSGATDDRA